MTPRHLDQAGRKRRRAAVALVLASVVVATGCAGFLQTTPESTPTYDGSGFAVEDVAEDVGFEYSATDRQMFGNLRTGVFVTDFDRDGWPDILAVGDDEPTLFENTGGAFEPSGALPPVNITVKGALFFDYDNDGDDDLLLLPFEGRPVFLVNDDGAFHRERVGLEVPVDIGVTASAADYDGDGCLDVFVAQNGDWRVHPPMRAKLYSRQRSEPPGGTGGDESLPVVRADNGLPNMLFRGTCGSFERVGEEAGIFGHHWSIAVSFVDLTGDGRPDIHVGNDFSHDVLYTNLGDGTFDYDRIEETNRHAMSSEIDDVNGDGKYDVFVTNINLSEPGWRQVAVPSFDNTGNNLLINQGDGEFASLEGEYGVAAGGWGWAAVAVDMDNDRDRDLIHAADYYQIPGELDEVVETYPSVWEFENGTYHRINASERGFEVARSRGIAHLDFDRDGDQDVVFSNADGAYRLHENRHDGGHSLQVTVSSDGAPALGSEVQVTAGGVTRHAVLNAKADMISQDTRFLHFGLGANETADVRIETPDGSVHEFADVAADQRLVLEPDGELMAVEEAGE